MPRKGFAGAAVPTTLGSAILSTDTTFTIASATGWTFTNAGGPFVVVIDRGTAQEEKILCSGIAGTTVTVAAGGRGYDGTTAFGHGAAATVLHVLDSITVDEANAHTNVTTRDDHTQYLRTDGTRASTGAQVFGAQVTVQAGVLVSGGPTGYLAGEVQFPYSAVAATAGQGAGISTLNTGAVGMFFDHRGAGNTGEWRWRNGTGASVTQMTLSATGALALTGSLAAVGITSTALVTAQAAAVGNVALRADGLLGQTADLFQARVNGTAVGTVTAGGKFIITGGIDLSGSPSGYVGGEIKFVGAAPSDTSPSIGTDQTNMNFDHRRSGNTGGWLWRNGANAATTRMTLGSDLDVHSGNVISRGADPTNEVQVGIVGSGTGAGIQMGSASNFVGMISGSVMAAFVGGLSRVKIDANGLTLAGYNPGTTHASLMSAASSQVFGTRGFGANADGAAFQGGVTVGLSIAVNRVDPAASINNSGGPILQGWAGATKRYELGTGGNTQAMGNDHYFGANAFGAAGSALHIGSLGDANNAYVESVGSGAAVGLVLRGKGTTAGSSSIVFQPTSGQTAGYIDTPNGLTTDQTPLFIGRQQGATFSIQRVTEGAADSGGVGFRVLRIPN